MTARRDAQVAAAVLEMRTPLARVELLASQLARHASTPVHFELAGSLSAAVAELDLRIDQSLRALAPAADSPRADCRPVLEGVHARLAPVLRARGVAATLRLPERPVPGDAEAAHHAALALVRAGLSLCGRGGALELGLVCEVTRYGVAVHASLAHGGSPAPAAAAAADPFAAARLLALARGAELELTSGAGSQTAVLWLAPEPGP